MKIKYILFFFLFGCKITKGDAINPICFMKDNTDQIPLSTFRNLKASEGKIIRIKGIFHFNFEDIALYPGNSENSAKALWLNFSDSIKGNQEIRKFKDKRVIVIGRLSNAEHGHLNEYLATLDSVFCIKTEDK